MFDEAAIHAIDRPHHRLWTYYIFASILAGPAILFILPYRYFRYHSMRYRFDEEGISMSWGILFHREINLTYARIQDIHLSSNLIERWLGLAKIQIQTASATSGAEMTIEGVREFDALRDYLYTKMRGTRLHAAGETAHIAGAESAELAAVLADVAAEMHAIRIAIEARDGTPGRG